MLSYANKVRQTIDSVMLYCRVRDNRMLTSIRKMMGVFCWIEKNPSCGKIPSFLTRGLAPCFLNEAGIPAFCAGYR